MAKRSFLTVTDMFCGAGGSSLGVTAAGAELCIAMNHWNLAIETHNSNFPDADHVLCDISQTDPRWYPRTDVLIASPECTCHSISKGIKRKAGQKTMFEPQVCHPAAERSRATAWDVIRYAEYHRYEIILVENVPDFRQWELWNSWTHALQSLGYEFQVVYANSMFFHPTPQSRDRFYVVAWRRGNRIPDLAFRPSAYCPHCQQDVQAVQSWKNPRKPFGKYRIQYIYRCPKCSNAIDPYYYCAMNVIDWTLPAPKIADRTRPLKEKTIQRIKAGLERFKSTTGTNAGAVPPFLVSYYNTGRAFSLEQPVPTQTSVDRYGLVIPPFILSYDTRVSGKKAAIAPLDDPLPTQPGWALHYLIEPGTAIEPEQCGFRMLQPHEIQVAMAFPADYEIHGNQREKIKQLGNAVTPPVMKELFKRCAATLG